MCKTMGIPLVEGGIVDQPHIWLMQYAVCAQEVELYEASKNRPPPQAPQNHQLPDILKGVKPHNLFEGL